MQLPVKDKANLNIMWVGVLLGVLSLFIASLLLFDIRLPVALLFGPFLVFLLVPSMKLKLHLLHLLPFIVILLLRIYLGNSGDLYKIYEDEYYIFYDLSSIASFIYYVGYVYKRTKENDLPTSLIFYVKQLLFAYLLLAASYFIFFLNRLDIPKVNFFDPTELLLTILGVVFILSLVYKITYYKEARNLLALTGDLLDEDNNRYGLTDHEIKVYGQQVEDFFNNSTDFLDVNFNLGKLTSKLQIPKHHLSMCFANYFHMNFYSILAKYRIKRAIDIAVDSPTFTWESVAYDCGYSSTTTFNKHFKNITGNLPSEFTQEQLMLLRDN